jgi:hypothetical protein
VLVDVGVRVAVGVMVGSGVQVGVVEDVGVMVAVGLSVGVEVISSAGTDWMRGMIPNQIITAKPESAIKITPILMKKAGFSFILTKGFPEKGAFYP